MDNPNDLKLGDDGKGFTGLAYANGPGWYLHRNGTVRKDISLLPDDQKPSIGI